MPLARTDSGQQIGGSRLRWPAPRKLRPDDFTRRMGRDPYAMRHTYASFALDAGVSIFELARLMGTSVRVIDDTYGHLVRGSLDRVRIALEERAMRESADGP